MPKQTDPLVIPVNGDNTTMATMSEPTANQSLVSDLLGQNLAALGQTGVMAQNNFVQVNKAQDYDYLEGKRLVSLEEAVGVREVTSKTTPAGPNQG